LIESGLAEKRFGVFIDQLEDAPAAMLDFALERRHFTKLVRPHALSKMLVVTALCRRARYGSGAPRRSEAATVHQQNDAVFHGQKKLRSDTLSLRSVSEMKMKLLQAIFEEQVEEICLADSGGPGLGSVRQSLFVLIDRAQKLA
jgi:hypothetical protein